MEMEDLREEDGESNDATEGAHEDPANVKDAAAK